MTDRSRQTESEEMPRVTFRLPEPLKDQLDETWSDRGYADRTEFLRDLLRDELE